MPNRNRYTWTYFKFPKLYESYLTKLSKLPFFQYSIASVELCPTTQRPHIQGYTEFTESTSIQLMRSVLSGISSDACCVSLGSQKKNIIYCSKTDTQILPPITIGIPLTIEQGKRNDIHLSIALVKKNQSIREICNVATSYQSIRICEKYLQYNESPRPINSINVIWIYGPTGTGKTRYAFHKYPDLFRPTTFKWWEGYDGHKTILIDDFRKDFCKFHELLTLTDIYPFRVEVKGTSRQVQFDTIIFTCPFPPTELYPYREDIKQFTRRIQSLILVDETGLHLSEGKV